MCLCIIFVAGLTLILAGVQEKLAIKQEKEAAEAKYKIAYVDGKPEGVRPQILHLPQFHFLVLPLPKLPCMPRVSLFLAGLPLKRSSQPTQTVRYGECKRQQISHLFFGVGEWLIRCNILRLRRGVMGKFWRQVQVY